MADISFSRPSIDNQEEEKTAHDKANKGVGEATHEKGKTEDNTAGLYNEQLNTDPTKLYKYQNSNIAKDGAQYGSLTGKDFSNTLRLSREADAYNNTRAPVHITQRLFQDPTIQQLQKPKIETEEMREMDRNRQLDLNQKQLAQALQDAVNHKDLDAYKQYYEQLYGIQLTDYEARLLMRREERLGEMRNIFSKGLDEHSKLFNRWYTFDTWNAIYNLVGQDRTKALSLFQILLGGTALPDEQQKRYSKVRDQVCIERYGKPYEDCTPAQQDYIDMYLPSYQQAEAAKTQSDIAKASQGGWSDKEMDKTFGGVK